MNDFFNFENDYYYELMMKVDVKGVHLKIERDVEDVESLHFKVNSDGGLVAIVENTVTESAIEAN